MVQAAPAASHIDCLLAVDIGSTVIKVAQIDSGGKLVSQEFYERDFDAEIVDQVDSVLSHTQGGEHGSGLFICSSANGGLRVGIVSLTGTYSGTVYRNQVLLGGANPLFVHEMASCEPDPRYVDMLVVGGGIDCPDVGPMEALCSRLVLDNYRYGALVYAGNVHLWENFHKRFPKARLIRNPMTADLWGRDDTIFVALRDAYLDDLVYKQGISEVAAKYPGTIRPTPEVVSAGYYTAITERVLPEVSGPSILMDVGGATTDLHYPVELVSDDSTNRPPTASSVGRYVFTDLGVYVSRNSTMLQLRSHPRMFEFLDAILDTAVEDTYRTLREGDSEATPQLLSYACIFLGLDRFSRGASPGLPIARVERLEKLILTGGATLGLDRSKVARIASLFLSKPVDAQFVLIDGNYEIWVMGAVAETQRQSML